MVTTLDIAEQMAANLAHPDLFRAFRIEGDGKTADTKRIAILICQWVQIRQAESSIHPSSETLSGVVNWQPV